MNKILWLGLFLLTACATPLPITDVKQYQLKMADQIYRLEIEEFKNGVLIQTGITAESTHIPLVFSESDPKILEGSKNIDGAFSHHKEFSEIIFTKIYIAPYYSLFSYNFLSRLKEYQDGMFYPECPPQSKYLVLLQINHRPMPLLACAF